MPQTTAEKRWTCLVDRYEQSGQTIRDFAEANDVNPKTLASWRSKLKRARRREEEVVFVELDMEQPAAVTPPVPPDAEHDAPTILLALDGYLAHVVIDQATDLALLRRVLDALC